MKMIVLRRSFIVLAALAASVAATPAAAQATRTWVSGVGDDVNPCSRTAPCKTFAGAISKTAAGGEINCLDPGGFGTVTITKSMTIDCTGTFGSVLSSGTTGVVVNGPNINVTLRGLSINGATPSLPGVNGIRFAQGRSLTVIDSIIQNFNGASPNGFGIIVNPSANASLVVRDVVFSNNGTAGAGGSIGIIPTGTAAVVATIENSTLTGSPGSGLRVDTGALTGGTGVRVQISNSRISQNLYGINVASLTGTPSVIGVVGSTIHGHTTAIVANGISAQVRLSANVISNNITGTNPAGSSTIASYGDNVMFGNVGDGTLSPVAIQPKR